VTRGTLDEAREAASRMEFRRACELFAQIDERSLTGDDLQAKADALWWTSRIEESIDVRQKAYAAFVAEGAHRRASFNAWFLSVDYMLKGEPAIGSGWLMRAKRDLGDDTECVERGLLMLLDAAEAHGNGDLEGASALAQETMELGKRLRSADLTAYAVELLGRFTIYAGRIDEGTKLLDEAMAAVLSGLISPLYTGVIYCDVLSACVEIADLGRASQWSDTATRWFEEYPDVSPFHGLCRIHRVDLATLRGAWEEAEADARLASEELAVIRPLHAAMAIYALGEINRRRGDLSAAEEEFERAHGLGRDPQPGLALIRLEQGNADAAAAGLRLPLAEPVHNPLERARLLSAHVEVSLARGDVEDARSACGELLEIAERWRSPLLHATARVACAARALFEGDAVTAAGDANRASRLLADLRLPHEAALTRLLLGVACRRSGDEERARLEISAARAELERLGAKLDARKAAELLEPAAAGPPRGLSEREVEVLRLVASGKTNREIAAEMVISEHTVSRHLQNIFRKLGVSSRAAATAFAFENSLVPR
jgi:ATP/maltotriose-dependent transcriptional regulator MalT